ncbi:NAD(P)-dependent oxidoreductase [Galbitalea sp. SE-J8]|uniref:NAD-dependent epimerase/dehydratase family protein n=1 Tax=Galbitalea sp. SE-J8 TaxID=3054952 RepID=UPI00259CF068|nr:NAD(P)-dependent oxidoreductase [Galbitalea sp. SE-J8]MDM4763772.1 NAD(P)-dependent oxidoreductase [Galbitalea sp. SE-J8]
MRILVTGASGKLGAVVSSELAAEGHEVVRADVAGARAEDFVRVDLTDYGQVADVLAGLDDRYARLDAVVHLGAISAPGLAPDAATFHNNLTATFNVFQGARRAGIRRIVYASSETVLGLPFETPPPYVPVDERYPTRPESTYSLVKHLEEELAGKLSRWDASLSITALRFSNVMVPADYAEFESWQHEPARRAWNLWGYIDARDGAHAVSRALQVAAPGFDRFVIAAADTVMRRPSAELLDEFFPDVARTRAIEGRETLLGIDHAREVLGYAPQHSWLDSRFE